MNFVQVKKTYVRKSCSARAAAAAAKVVHSLFGTKFCKSKETRSCAFIVAEHPPLRLLES